MIMTKIMNKCGIYSFYFVIILLFFILLHFFIISIVYFGLKKLIIKQLKNNFYMWRDKLDVVEYDTNLNPLPNDKRFNYLKEENGII